MTKYDGINIWPDKWDKRTSMTLDPESPIDYTSVMDVTDIRVHTIIGSNIGVTDSDCNTLTYSIQKHVK